MDCVSVYQFKMFATLCAGGRSIIFTNNIIMVMTIIVLQLAILLICVVSSTQFQEIDVDPYGNSFSDQSDDVEEEYRGVSFTNQYEGQSIIVYWYNDGDDVEMVTIEPTQTAELTTTTGHSFYALASLPSSSEMVRVNPYLVTIQSDSDSYEFGPPKATSSSAASISSVKVSAPVADAGLLSHPSVRLINRRSTSMSAKFRCLVPKMDYWYEDGRDGVYQGTLTMGRESTTNTYEGHVFYFTEPGDQSKELARFTMDKDRVVYAVSNPKYPVPEHLLKLNVDEQKYMEEYYNRTGLHWRHFFGPRGPRGPPVLHMWEAAHVGQVHPVVSQHGFWHCKGSKEDCQSESPVHFNLTVVSLAPRVFIIEKFFSEFEANEIISMANPKVKESFVGNSDEGGGRTSDTRTSRNTWIPRPTSDITESLSRRAADLLNVDEKLLWSNKNAEDMQVVSYENGQKYEPHHDWGVSGYAESRFITLLLYLTTQPHAGAGGETAFPKGNNGLGFKVAPKKGDAVLFYNLLEDGNGDDLALHAALPATEGKKWLANYWVWDPKRKP